MKDARSLVFVGEKRRGVGTRMSVATRVGPFRTTDILEVVGWDEGRSIDVAHQGLVRGRGRLSATPDDGDTVVTWDEELAFPWWLGGAITGWFARPLLAATWKGNLARLEDSLRSP
jgi:hypothetical protein